MIENLCMYGLPFASRQNEMIEMALTFRFHGIEVDMDEMGRRAEAMGQEFATQFVNSAKIDVASFRLPIDFGAEDEAFEASKNRLESLCEIAEAIHATRAYVPIAPGSDRLAFQENFELHRTRIGEVADRLAQSNIKLALLLNALPTERAKYEFQFICKAEELLALIGTINHPNVGLLIDTFQWQLGDGAMDQIEEFGVEKIFDTRLADLLSGYDPEKISAADRVAPGEGDSTMAIKLLRFLHENGYDQTVAVVCSFPGFKDRSRGVMTVEKIRVALNQVLIQSGAVSEEEIAPLPVLGEQSDSSDVKGREGSGKDASGDGETTESADSDEEDDDGESSGSETSGSKSSDRTGKAASSDQGENSAPREASPAT